jgi:Integrase core domain
MSFTGRLQGVQVAFERNLAELGVHLICSGPYHPQTLGKLERFHRTLKDWLSDEGPAEDVAHLQELLDGFRFHYNRERPHQGIGDVTPAERFGIAPAPLAPPSSGDLVDLAEPSYAADAVTRKVTSSGEIGYRSTVVHLGRRWAGATVQVLERDGLVNVCWGDKLVRTLTIDPTKRRHGRLREETIASKTVT